VLTTYFLILGVIPMIVQHANITITVRSKILKDKTDQIFRVLFYCQDCCY